MIGPPSDSSSLGDQLASSPPAFTDEQRRARLRFMRRWATGLLIAMSVLFLALELARESLPAWTRYLSAFAEAAMVGALADWFAVTALFRRPLGLPIPHTAIIPEQKARIGTSLGRFVQTHFLAPDVIQQRLDNLDVADRLQHWLAEPQNLTLLSQRIASALPALLDRLDDDTMEEMLGRNLQTQLEKVPVAPLAAQLLVVMTQQNQHQTILNALLRWGDAEFQRRKPDIRLLIRKESPWYLRLVDRPLFEKIVDVVERTLTDINADPNHPMRQEVSLWLADLIDKLQTSEELHIRLEIAKTQLLEHPRVKEYFSQLWHEIRVRLRADLESGQLQARIEQGLRSLAERLLADAELRQQVNQAVRKGALDLVEAQRDNVGRLIAETVQRWETPTLVDRLELMVGRDLQFIRINGTLVGGAVGVVLYIVRQYL